MRIHYAGWARHSRRPPGRVRSDRAIPLLLAFLVFNHPSATAAQSLPSGWSASNVGSPLISGSASYDSGVFSLSGAGSDLLGTSDQLMFVHRQVTGDAVIIAR